jgi:hypothetical protein
MHITTKTEGKKHKLFGNGRELILIDTMGFDHQLTETNPEDDLMKFLQEIEEYLKNNHASTIDYILYCWNATSRWTTQEKDLIFIIKSFLPMTDQQRLILVITKCGDVAKENIAKAEAQIKNDKSMRGCVIETLHVQKQMEQEMKNKTVAFFDAREHNMSVTLKTYKDLSREIQQEIVRRMANLTGLRCFSGRSAVLLADGNLKSMKDLQIGDELLTANKSVIGKAKICSFLHYEPETIATFLQFRLKNGTVLEVTHEHMIAVYSRQNHQTAFLLAQNAAVGDCLVEYQNGIMALEEIVEIALIEEKGIYAPLTTSGTLIVNSCLASCYASFESQMLCHLAMLPLIIYTSVHKQEPTVGIHSYCRTLQQFLPLLSPGK